MSTDIKTLANSINCQGISVRTTNQTEMDLDTAKIGRMWQTFYEDYFEKLSAGS